MGMLGDIESIEINRISRIVEFDLDLAFCSATLTVKDWDTFDILSFFSPVLAAGEEDTYEVLAEGVGYHHVLVLDPSKEVVID